MNQHQSSDRPMAAALAAAVLVAALLGACSSDDPPPPWLAELACHTGAWRFDSGETLVLTPVDNGLRYRLLDGRSGRFEPGDDGRLEAREGWRSEGPVVAMATPGPCRSNTLGFQLEGGPSGTATRLELPVTETTFGSGDLTLRGRLVMPAQANGPVPLAVLVHGSEDYSAVDIYPKQYLLPAQGVAVFVYDKRGTGGSEGEYTQDFHVLADDAIAALDTARRLRPDAFSRAGFIGSSQGGWIAPLAASQADVDYVVVEYGLADTALAEDREQVIDDLRAAGHDDKVLAKAREVTDATALLITSGFTRGFDELDDVRRSYGEEPWFADIRGEFTGMILDKPAWLPQWLMRAGFARLDVQTSWEYEPIPVLEALPMPQLWIIAGEDLEAPNSETLRRIRMLQSQGLDIDLAVFPDTDHGIYEFVEQDGSRTMLRHPDGYLRLLAQWAAGSGLHGNYGSAQLEPARPRSAGPAPFETTTAASLDP
ncbi:alpha/beta hydrolase family protein [Luteimonas sp. A277]